MNQHQFAVNIGSVVVTLSSRGLLKEIDWHWTQPARGAGEQLTLAPPVMTWLMKSFGDYFSSGVPLGEPPWELMDDSEWTPFQRQVYRAIASIPHGETRTYGWVAARLGSPSAGRAVGQALRANPLPILIPCHRVVSVASVGGFMGALDPDCSEIRLKQRLIVLEEEYINPLFDFLTPTRDLFAPIPAPAPVVLEPVQEQAPLEALA